MTHWQVRHQTFRGSYGAWTNIPGDGSVNEHTVTGLDAGVFYILEVRAGNGALHGPAAEPAGATPTGPVPPPDAVGASTIAVAHNGDSLTVSWDAPSRATCYDVTFNDGHIDARA